MLGLLIALLLNRKFTGRWLVQTIVLLAADGGAGHCRDHDPLDVQRPVRHRERSAGCARHRTSAWLTQRWTAFFVILLTDVWLWTPWFALLLLAGLQSLPSEPFEAAQIDAASTWRTFRYITLPMLRPVIVVCVVIRADRRLPHLRHRVDHFRRRARRAPPRCSASTPMSRAFQFLNLGRGSAAAVDRRRHHRDLRHGSLSGAQPLGGGLEMSVPRHGRAAVERLLRGARRPAVRRVLLALATVAVCLLFAFPDLLADADLAPAGLRRLLRAPRHRVHAPRTSTRCSASRQVLKALCNSFAISTLATVLSLGVTVTSGYMLSRFKGPIPSTWFGADLRVPLRAVRLLGAAALFRHASGSASSTPIGACCCRTSPCTSASSPGS